MELIYSIAASPIGWAHLWSSKDGDDYRRFCPCEKFKKGKPKIVDRELKQDEFYYIAGGMITAKDWKLFREMKKSQ